MWGSPHVGRRCEGHHCEDHRRVTALCGSPLVTCRQASFSVSGPRGSAGATGTAAQAYAGQASIASVSGQVLGEYVGRVGRAGHLVQLHVSGPHTLLDPQLARGQVPDSADPGLMVSRLLSRWLS